MDIERYDDEFLEWFELNYKKDSPIDGRYRGRYKTVAFKAWMERGKVEKEKSCLVKLKEFQKQHDLSDGQLIKLLNEIEKRKSA